MKKVSITIEDYLYTFYMRVGENAGGIKPEQVMADALYKLAGELSLRSAEIAKKVNADYIGDDGP